MNLSDRKNYTSQINLLIKLLKNTKRTYFNSLDVTKVTDNRTFWKTVAPLFSNKFSKSEKINLTEENKTISNYDGLYRVFNNFFSISLTVLEQLISLKFWIFQTISLITQMIHSKKHWNILKITLVLQL